MADFLSDVGGFLFGNGKRPGILGTGQYEVQAPNVNTAAGALPGARGIRGTIAEEEEAARARQAPTVTAARVDSGPQDEMRRAQTGLVGDLQAASRGEGPSVAQEQLRRGVEANLAATVAATNTARGMGAAGGVRDLMASQATVRQQGAADAATLRAQEIATARGQLGEVTAQARGQDVQLASTNAQLEQQASTTNADAELRNRAAADEYMRSLIAMGLDASKAEQMANIRLEELRTQSALDVERLRLGSYQGAAASNLAAVKGIAAGASQVFGLGAKG